MSEALIASLNQRISALEAEKANLQTALKQARGERKTAIERANGLDAQVATLTTERDTALKAASAAPDDLKKQVSNLQGQLSQRDHRDAFRSAARKAGVKESSVDDLYNLSGLKPGESPADPEHFADFLTAQKEARSWAFDGDSQSQGNGQPAGNGQSAAKIQLQPTTAPAGSGRGVPDRSSSMLKVSAANLADGLWMQANQTAVATASREGRLVVE